QHDRGVFQVGQLAYQIMEVLSGLGVEADGRLIQEQQVGPTDEADGYVQASPLPAGELGQRSSGLPAQTDASDQLIGTVRARALRRAVGSVEAAEIGQQLADPPSPVVAP